jgi:hypothetical protein
LSFQLVKIKRMSQNANWSVSVLFPSPNDSFNNFAKDVPIENRENKLILISRCVGRYLPIYKKIFFHKGLYLLCTCYAKVAFNIYHANTHAYILN